MSITAFEKLTKRETASIFRKAAVLIEDTVYPSDTKENIAAKEFRGLARLLEHGANLEVVG